MPSSPLAAFLNFVKYKIRFLLLRNQTVTLTEHGFYSCCLRPFFVPARPADSCDMGQPDTIVARHFGEGKAKLLLRQLIPCLIISGCLAFSLPDSSRNQWKDSCSLEAAKRNGKCQARTHEMSNTHSSPWCGGTLINTIPDSFLVFGKQSQWDRSRVWRTDLKKATQWHIVLIHVFFKKIRIYLFCVMVIVTPLLSMSHLFCLQGFFSHMSSERIHFSCWDPGLVCTFQTTNTENQLPVFSLVDLRVSLKTTPFFL